MTEADFKEGTIMLVKYLQSLSMLNLILNLIKYFEMHKSYKQRKSQHNFPDQAQNKDKERRSFESNKLMQAALTSKTTEPQNEHF